MATRKTAAKNEAATEETSTDVAVVEKGTTDVELAAAQAELMAELQEDFAEELNMQEDIRLPEMRLIQNTNIPEDVDGAAPGKFCHMGTSQVFTEIEIVVCKLMKTRTRFGETLGERPLCTSPDSKNGYGDPGDDLTTRGPNGGGACAVCPEGKIGRSCKLQYNYVSLLVGGDGDSVEFEHSLPITVQMKGTSVKTATRLNGLLMEAASYMEYTIILSSVREENEHGNYRVFKMRRGRKATPEMVEKAVRIGLDMKKAQEAQKQLVMDEGPSASGGRPSPEAKDSDGDIPF